MDEFVCMDRPVRTGLLYLEVEHYRGPSRDRIFSPPGEFRHGLGGQNVAERRGELPSGPRSRKFRCMFGWTAVDHRIAIVLTSIHVHHVHRHHVHRFPVGRIGDAAVACGELPDREVWQLACIVDGLFACLIDQRIRIRHMDPVVFRSLRLTPCQCLLAGNHRFG